MSSTLTAPTYDVDFNNFEDLLNLKCDVYYSLGEMDAISDIPTSQLELEALYTGVSPKFKPLGELDEDPVEFGGKRNSEKMHRGVARGNPNFEGVIKSIALCPDMLSLLDSADLDGVVSLLLVPHVQPSTFSSSTPGLFLALNGVKLVEDIKGNVSGKKQSVVFNLSAEPDSWKQVIKFAFLELTGMEAPAVPESVVIDTVTNVSLRVSWAEVTKANRYTVQIDTSADFDVAPVLYENITDLNKPITGLSPETVYFVRVKALNPYTGSDWSAVVSEITEATPVGEFMLLESGDYLLLESGDKITIEAVGE